MESVLEIFIIENVLNGAEQPQTHPIASQWKCVTGGQIGSTVSLKAVSVRAECSAAENRGEIRTRRQNVEAHPEPFNALGYDKRELMIGNSERFPVRARDSRPDSPRVTDVAIRKSVRSKYVRRSGRPHIDTKLRTARKVTISVVINRCREIARYR